MIVIFLQDINFIRIKLYSRASNNVNINSISMRELNAKNVVNEVVDEDKERQFIEKAFSDALESQDKQVEFFLNYN